MKPLNCFTVSQIVALRNAGLSFGKIKSQLNLPARQTAYSAYQRYCTTGQFQPKKPTGRPRKLTKKDKEKLVKDVLKDPKRSLQQIRVHWNSFAVYHSVSKATIRRILKKYGVHSRNAAKKLKLAKKSEENRLIWCRKMQKEYQKDPFFWQKVIFTDETRVRLYSDGIVRVFRKNGTTFAEKNSQMTGDQ